MKAWTIAWKDTLIRLRDRNAFVLVLLAPLVITAIMGVALGDSNGTERISLKDITLIVVNDDRGELGQQFISLLGSHPSANLFKPTTLPDLAAARKILSDGAAQAVLYIPADFSRSLQTDGASGGAPERSSHVQIELYTREAGSEVSQLTGSVVDQLLVNLKKNLITSGASLNQLPGKLNETESAAAGALVAGWEADTASIRNPSMEVKLNSRPSDNTAEPPASNPFAFFAPSLAIFFLMFTMFEAPRSILAEQEDGTLGRLMRTPTRPSQILLGKLGGSYLTGILQFIVLVIATRLIFGLTWGESLPGLLLMVVSVVMAAASLGAVIAAFSKDVIQAGVIGGGITLLSAGLGGNFATVDGLPSWLQVISRLTINRWALEGFSYLTVRKLGLEAILPNAGVLLAMAGLLFVLAFWKFQRRLTT